MQVQPDLPSRTRPPQNLAAQREAVLALGKGGSPAAFQIWPFLGEFCEIFFGGVPLPETTKLLPSSQKSWELNDGKWVVFFSQYDRFLSYRMMFSTEPWIMGERVTWHLKMDGWNTFSSPFWDDLFLRCDNVCFRIYVLRKKPAPEPPWSSMGYSQGWLKNEAIDRMKTFHRWGCFSNFSKNPEEVYSWVYRWIISSPTETMPSCYMIGQCGASSGNPQIWSFPTRWLCFF